MTQTKTATELLERMHEYGIPNSEIADHFGVHRNTVARWARGIGDPTRTQMRELHKAAERGYSVIELSTTRPAYIATWKPWGIDASLVRKVLIVDADRKTAKIVRDALDRAAQNKHSSGHQASVSQSSRALTEAAAGPSPLPGGGLDQSTKTRDVAL